VDAPGTSTTEEAGNGSQFFYRGRAQRRSGRRAPFFPGAGFPVQCGRSLARARAHRRRSRRQSLRERRFLLARYEYAPRHVVDARWLGDYKVWLEFNDGRKGVVDLADELHGEELEPLRDRDRFSQFYLDYGLASIAWLDGQDFTPEFLYDKLRAMH
jgi:hypothetical protein